MAHNATTPAAPAAAETTPPLKGDIWSGTEVIRKGFSNDPVQAGYFGSVDTFPFRTLRNKLVLSIIWAAAIWQGRMLTIDNGAAIMKYAAPGDKDPWIVGFLMRLLRIFGSVEFNKRRGEFVGTVHNMYQDAFGDRNQAMYDVQAVAVDPDVHGSGWGTALMNHIMAKADADGRDIKLCTTTAVRFYERLGFSVVRVGLIAADNPSWDGEPIKVHIMCRPAKIPASKTVPT
ncbi:hypothetical protein L226DRAFT_556798 [Lentinus tigrinus ALCF2SS1-7]|uniref:uncharacterized protein n=1 Tax=Lentinus tigrinus ALCF2SS1-7 TaxID=1328758 RepID=UPI00116635D6|nr:hypothetical protein L226DRAFT_556798 [Lentinus tigrinus ALCF2SS1-7]